MKYNINLLAQKEMSLIDKTLYFFLNYLRYILVITQLIVIGVLFYRFRIDQSITDLKDSLDQKKAIVTVVQPLLAQAKKVDHQMTAIKEVTDDQIRHESAINYILSIFPASAFLTKFSTTNDKKNSIQLIGTTLDSRQLQLFYMRLQKEHRFGSVNLANIQRGDTGYEFTMKLESYTYP